MMQYGQNAGRIGVKQAHAQWIEWKRKRGGTLQASWQNTVRSAGACGVRSSCSRCCADRTRSGQQADRSGGCTKAEWIKLCSVRILCFVVVVVEARVLSSRKAMRMEKAECHELIAIQNKQTNTI